jgi:MtN3 and saliva related transmembrane protein
MMDATLIFGTLGSICSVGSFVAQARKIVQTRKTDAISTSMYALTAAGFASWVVYGAIIEQWPLIVTNSICLVLSSAILAMKLVSRRLATQIAQKQGTSRHIDD